MVSLIVVAAKKIWPPARAQRKGGVEGIPPRLSVPPERSGGGQFLSKKFRAKFRIFHQSQLSPFWERIASRLRRSAFGLCALRKAIKSHGGQKEKEMDLSFSYLK